MKNKKYEDGGKVKSKKLSSFGTAFAAARKAGDRTFEWKGKKYTTQMAGEGKDWYKKIAPKASKMETAQTIQVPEKETQPIAAKPAEAPQLAVKSGNTFSRMGENIRQRQLDKADSLAAKGKTKESQPDNATAKLKEAIKKRDAENKADRYLAGGKGKGEEFMRGGGKLNSYKMGGNIKSGRGKVSAPLKNMKTSKTKKHK